jgi:hypothetical protein
MWRNLSPKVGRPLSASMHPPTGLQKSQFPRAQGHPVLLNF